MHEIAGQIDVDDENVAEIDGAEQARNLRVFVVLGGAIALLVVAVGLAVMLSVGHKSAAGVVPNRPVAVPVPAAAAR